MDTRTKITLAWQLHEQGTNNSQIAKHLEVHRETVGLWLRDVHEQGLLAFLDAYRQANKQPRPTRQVPLSTKRLVWQLREREHDCCGQKIAYFLEQEHGLRLSVPKIYEILAEKYVIRSKWKKNHLRGPVPQASAPRQVVQMDTIDFGRVFAFTAVDIFSREADVFLATELTSAQGKTFLHECMARRFTPGYVRVLQTDGGPEFKGEFAQAVGGFCERHRLARPYKKNEQAYIESFNRTVRKECLGWGKYQPDELPTLAQHVEAFLWRYHHHRPHLAFEPLRPPLEQKPAPEQG
jgi:transposase InsO family protein